MKAKTTFVLVMLIFGSIGLFVRNIDLSSSEIALFRGLIGGVFLIGASFILKQKIKLRISKRNLFLLIFSGSALGFNWIFLFESYQHTTISNATLSYYFAPVFVMILAPIMLKERWTWKKGVSIAIAMIGLFLVIQPENGISSDTYNHSVGIIYGLLAAVLYASVIMMNKFMQVLSDFETTVIQLVVASIILLPYVLFTEDMNIADLGIQSIGLLVVVGIVHTGLAYLLYFASMKKISGQTIGILSYLDPISAVIMATILLQESMSILQMIGGVCILGSTFISELRVKKMVRG
ncbi:DMT family transporter [Ornithinibacillus contaminans]|uniref:DMT family transporter n=1 Tax=Ornithinibacillus contaminans TaxID=694055 RepID=UPI00064DC797|nr:DMT family transporter [Ornithinibacillus contaminans]